MPQIADFAKGYAERFGWWVFPCSRQKHPRLKNGFYGASTDPAQITAWWRRWPEARIGVWTKPSGLAVLDVDVKNPAKYGPDSLDRLGHGIPDSWIAHTPSGGWHCYFAAGELDVPSTEDVLGPGLDVRGNTGYIVAPAPGSGYSWDAHCNPDTLPLAPAPDWLIPPRPLPPERPPRPIKPSRGLGPYADSAIARACLNIRNAPDGQQRITLRDESFSIGTLVGAGSLPPAFARAALIDAGYGMSNHDPRHPWTGKEIARIVDGAFTAGCARPRSAHAAEPREGVR